MLGLRLETVVVEELLSYSETLAANYRLYHDLLHAMSERNFASFERIIHNKQSDLIFSYMKTSLKTLRKHAPHIVHSFTYENNNGRIEGINNKIKELNRVAYRYRNITYFKNRIMIHFKYRANDAIKVNKKRNSDTKATKVA